MFNPARVIVIGLGVTLFCVGQANAQFWAGAAKVDITPDAGVSLDGPISKNGSVASIHDPLHARALVASDGKIDLAIVVVDQCVTGPDVYNDAKKLIEQKTGIPTNHVLTAATHTHAAPRTVHIGREPIDDAYHQKVSHAIANAVIEAHQNLSPAKVAYASFDREDLLACRRFLCEPGSVQANPFGELGEQIKSVSGRSSAVLKPAGPVDPQFSVLAIKHQDGSPLCLLGNFSVHYCGGYKRGAVSADYFGYFCRAVENTLASQTPNSAQTHAPPVAIMSNGTSGNTGSFQRVTGKTFAPFEGMEFYGRMLAESAVHSIANLSYQNNVPLQMVESELELSIRRPNAERLKWAKQTLASDEKFPHPWTRVYAQEALHLAAFPATDTFKFQAIRIGEIGIAAAPCEVFAETGLALKEKSPLKHTFTIELANGYGGYLPTRQQHDLGGYETWPARSSFLEVDAETKIRSELARLLNQVNQ
ncbi:MAG: neutral/alkaline non-lysosomal ceramidase N-terminal domain-containing protein [Planctomycetales bacterium]|nr:neutral/alkaline non-lysosomal ceramidase N-terminal domain-containing protein [Planctomycetales bacterium]